MEMCRQETEDEKEREKVDWFSFLPDDIVLDILKRVDAFLRYKFKYVCRRWFSIMMSNRILLDRASFIIQKTQNDTARLVDMGEEGVKEQSLDIPCSGMIRCWCNEFLLISDYRRRSLHVYNLITKKGSYLPGCKAPCGGDHRSKCGVALSFDGFKGIYNVVHLFIGQTMQCHILILGKDAASGVTSKWKKIQVPNTIQGSLYRCSELISVESRYFHAELYRSNHLVSVDMVKEEVVHISLPDCVKNVRTLFVMGGFLGLAHGVSSRKTEIWVLKDFHRVKWEKLHSLSLNNWYFEPYPVSDNEYVFGMISRRHMILKCRDRKGMFSYDLENGALKRLGIHIEYNDERCVLQSSAPSFI